MHNERTCKHTNEHSKELAHDTLPVIIYSRAVTLHSQATQPADTATRRESTVGGSVSKLFGVYIEEEGLALRGTFIIDPNGVLKTAEVHDLGIGRSAAESLRKLEAAKFVHEHGDQVCPANWTPGGDTLKPGLDLVGKI